MSYSKKEIYEMLFQIFMKYKKQYKNPPKSKQMACMWSVTHLPDIIEDTPPFHDIQNTFNISIDENNSLELYDMNLNEATEKIANMLLKQC